MNDKLLLIISILLALILALAMSYNNKPLTDEELILMAHLYQ